MGHASTRDSVSLSRFLSFSRDEWARLRQTTPLTLSDEDLKTLRGLNDVLNMQDVVDIYLPLSRPGVVNGVVLVFVMGLGYFITPALLGGAGDAMIAQLIEQQVADFGEWGVAGALSVILMFGVGVTFALLFRTGTAANK